MAEPGPIQLLDCLASCCSEGHAAVRDGYSDSSSPIVDVSEAELLLGSGLCWHFRQCLGPCLGVHSDEQRIDSLPWSRVRRSRECQSLEDRYRHHSERAIDRILAYICP